MLKIEIIGNLGGEAVIRELNGQKLLSFSVAVTEKFRNSKNVQQERVTWFSCLYVANNNLMPYLKKGTKVFVRGNLRSTIYDYKGQPAINHDINVREIELLSSKQDTGQRQEQEPIPATHDNDVPF